MKLKATLLVAMFAGTLTAYADVVKGRVVDAETKEPLPEAQLKFDHIDEGWTSASASAITSTQRKRTDYLVVWKNICIFAHNI